MRSRVLDAGDRALVTRLLDADPVGNCFVASRVEAGVLDPSEVGELWGYPAHAPRSLLHVGANIVPVAADAEALDAFALDIGRWRSFVAIVGPVAQVFGLWDRLSAEWPHAYADARVVRERQLLMACTGPTAVDADPRLRPARAEDFDSYFAGAVHMYREELEEDPLTTNPVGYRRYVRSLIDDRRAFAIVEDGRVVFKADLGAMSRRVAQVQGVWVAPDLRGRGLSVPAMAGVTDAILAGGRIASLYVNDFNAPAIACYERVGYDVVGELTTVLF
ncbi:GNAT family N-acetyltransferase [Propioniciclava sp. MC1595]|uniref:GNAT family N-acetyltransferase n=1 Tax=Propioniciclava sp. MC1595 TaxID=2760308 RepID=UPI001662701F|nr:GNAT family N-acetyltransferase [Propioniciclava sp. MC1595]MBB1493856.1 GNAT family N-acetyltransferase [Propioniciclava sp. MC1595]QTE24954.1 GNAT family N-acetyltransferase [Propioniciclava sp. MC1595]